MMMLNRCAQSTVARSAPHATCSVAPTHIRCPSVKSVQGEREAGPSSYDGDASRRAVLLSCAGALLMTAGAAAPEMASADDEVALFKGMATPPTSYGGYGGNKAGEAPKYTFEYPPTWKVEKISKVEKGTQGIDGRVSNPKSKGMGAFVITLGRAGEDNKGFRLTDLESTFNSFVGADYNMQDAVQNATNTTRTQVQVDDIDFFQYDIESPEFRYLASIAVKNGKVFALFVRSPSKAFNGVEGKLRHIIETFRLLA